MKWGNPNVFCVYVQLCSSFSAILLFCAAYEDPKRVVGQWPLQRFGLVPRRTHPNVAFLLGGQDYRHRFGVDRRDDRVRRGRSAVGEGGYGPMIPQNRGQGKPQGPSQARPSITGAEGAEIVRQRGGIAACALPQRL